MKWFLAILLALVGAALVLGFVAGIVLLGITFPVQTGLALVGLAFVGLVWLLAVHLHTWLLDRAYVRNKKRARKLDLLAAHEEALAELAERDNAVRTER